MIKDFFKQVRILDGGMGQELLARGLEINGTLWSANALLKEQYHQVLMMKATGKISIGRLRAPVQLLHHPHMERKTDGEVVLLGVQ